MPNQLENFDIETRKYLYVALRSPHMLCASGVVLEYCVRQKSKAQELGKEVTTKGQHNRQLTFLFPSPNKNINIVLSHARPYITTEPLRLATVPWSSAEDGLRSSDEAGKGLPKKGQPGSHPYTEQCRGQPCATLPCPRPPLLFGHTPDRTRQQKFDYIVTMHVKAHA